MIGRARRRDEPGDTRCLLEGFSSFSFESDGAARTVYTRGSGPGVVVMHEIPGITPAVARFATRVADAGFRVYLPHMFGTPGKPFSVPYVLSQAARACVSREFSVLAPRGVEPDHAVAARALPARARGVRRTRRGRARHVPDRKLRARADGRRSR